MKHQDMRYTGILQLHQPTNPQVCTALASCSPHLLEAVAKGTIQHRLVAEDGVRGGA
jgi:hypothetical protein